MLKHIFKPYIQGAVAGIAVSALAILGACTTSGTISEPSRNFNSRVSIIVIHHTTADFDGSLQVLTQPSSNPVSSHYLIPEPDDSSYDKSKLQVHRLVSEESRAWHAGVSHWAGKNGLNDQSIGIELVNQTYCHRSTAVDEGADQPAGRICFFPDFADSQIALLVDLLGEILQRHPDVPPTHVIGHADIAPDRKIDPGPRFPWQTVIRYWEQFTQQPLPLANVQSALKAYGYGIEVTGLLDQQTQNVLRAFQMHFRPSRVTSEATTETVAVLYALIDKYYPDQLDELLHVDDEPEAAPDPEPSSEADLEPAEQA
jgi:N-acetylmuramoyl-L-alanine amidase